MHFTKRSDGVYPTMFKNTKRMRAEEEIKERKDFHNVYNDKEMRVTYNMSSSMYCAIWILALSWMHVKLRYAVRPSWV